MIEVLFNESEEVMKTAKSMAVKPTVSFRTVNGSDGSTAVSIVGKKKFSDWILGTAEEVVYLGFMLDIGDIGEMEKKHTVMAFLRHLEIEMPFPPKKGELYRKAALQSV